MPRVARVLILLAAMVLTLLAAPAQAGASVTCGTSGVRRPPRTRRRSRDTRSPYVAG